MKKSDQYRKEMQARNNARSQCYNVNASNYANEGAKGIRLCERWLESFDAFLEDMGPKPANTKLCRIDRTRNYEPQNCCWKPVRERKPRKQLVATCGRPAKRMMTCKGQTLSLAEWSRRSGLEYTLLAYRWRVGWTAEQVLGFEPPPARKNKGGKRSKPITAFGVTRSSKEWAQGTDLTQGLICNRLLSGWSPEDAVKLPRSAQRSK